MNVFRLLLSGGRQPAESAHLTEECSRPRAVPGGLRPPLRFRRRGVSLLEVLVSIGVTSVGLLGVLSLIPLGGSQARQGQVMERSAWVANGALGEIRMRDMLSTPTWITKTGVAVNPSTAAYCIDPVGIANGSAVTLPASASAQMQRITLWNNLIGAPDTTPNLGKVMSLQQADLIFRSQDDLSLIESSADRTLPPFQDWQRADTDAVTRRQTEGSMSWMFTVFPNYAKGTPNDMVTVSIVIFNRRVVDPALTTEFTTAVMTAADYPGAGIAGGDMIFTFANAAVAQEAKTPENSWVLLSGRDTHTTTPVNLFQWYRVIASDPDPTNPARRYVTLAGPDWNTSLTNVQATIIPGTVAVIQENMQFEATSLWRN